MLRVWGCARDARGTEHVVQLYIFEARFVPSPFGLCYNLVTDT